MTYMVGDRIQGAEVIDIQRERVIIINAGRKEFIDGNPGDGSIPAPTFTAPPAVAEAKPAGPPNSGLGSGIAPITDLYRRKVGVALGTDGAASNDSQNLLEAMKLAADYHGLLERARLAGRHDLLVGERQQLAELAREDLLIRLADELLRLVAEMSRARGVDHQVPAIPVLDVDAVLTRQQDVEECVVRYQLR